jgi:nucleoside-diphosphate-sugar epimerase
VTPQIRGKVLVTGAHGFIGRALCRHLSATGVAYVTACAPP